MSRSPFAVALLVCVLATACGPSADQKQQAIAIAKAKVGDCLGAAGYNTQPDTLAAVTGYDVGLIFHSTKGAKPVRINVKIADKTIVGLDGGDVKRLQQAGCTP